jgi:hypothetical protein
LESGPSEATKAGAQASTEYFLSTAARASCPIRRRRVESLARFRIAVNHSSGVVAKNPETPGSTISAWTPTGLATTGSPAAWY